MEGIDSLHLLTSTNELDGLVHHGTDRESSTTTGITVKFGKDNTGIVKAVIELLGGVHCILTGHSINHEEYFVRIDGILDVGNLLHQFLVDSQTTGGIDNDNIMRL